MRAFSYITYQDILDRDPIANFCSKNQLSANETRVLMKMCEAYGISGTAEILKVIQAGKTATYHQLRHLYNEIKLRRLLLELLRDGASISDEALLDRAERFKGLVKTVNGQRVIVGTYRNLVQRQSFHKVKRRKAEVSKHPDVV